MKICPPDFIDKFNSLLLEDKLTFRNLQIHYNTSNMTIHRWLKESHLSFNSPFAKKTYYSLDKDMLLNDILSCNYDRVQLKHKYMIKYAHLKRFCEENNLIVSEYLNTSYVENIKYFEEFKKFVIKHGKQSAATKYNITLSTVINICKRNNIDVIPYAGVILDTKVNLEKIQEDLKNDNMSLTYIGKKHGVTSLTLKRYCEKYNINKKTQFDLWKEEYDYVESIIDKIKDENYNNKKTLIDIAREYNVSINHIKRAFDVNNINVALHGCTSSVGEKEVFDYITSITSYDEVSKFRKTFNDKKYEIDIYSIKNNLGIEYCGEYWHSDINLDKKYHQNKFIWAKEQGIELLHIFESEWKTKTDIVKSIIHNKLNINDTKIYARKCVVKEISSSEAKSFFDDNHISGGIYSKINLALEYNGIIVSVLSFSKPRFTKDIEYEITRFASIKYTSVIGGFSKLFSYFIKTYSPNSILTFADLRFGQGKTYEKCGFTFEKTTTPNYYYFSKHTQLLESRVKYQKHKLSKILNIFDPAKSEYENMTDNGFYRVFDCGNNLYVWRANSL